MPYHNFVKGISDEQIKNIQSHLTQTREVRSRVDVEQMIPYLETFSKISVFAANIATIVEERITKTARILLNLTRRYSDSAAWKVGRVIIIGKLHRETDVYLQTFNQNHKSVYETCLHILLKCNARLANLMHELNEVFLNSSEEQLLIVHKEIRNLLQSTKTTNNIVKDLIVHVESSKNIVKFICNPLHTDHNRCFHSLRALENLTSSMHETLQYVLDSSSLITPNNSDKSAKVFNIARVTYLTEETNFKEMTENFTHFLAVVHDCYKQHKSAIAQMFTATSDKSLPNISLSDQFGELLISNSLSTLKKVQGIVKSILSDYIENVVTRKEAGEKLISIIKTVSKSAENIKLFLHNRLHTTWPEIIRAQVEAITHFYYNVIQALRSVSVHCSYCAHDIETCLYNLITLTFSGNNNPAEKNIKGVLKMSDGRKIDVGELAKQMSLSVDESFILANDTTLSILELMDYHFIHKAYKTILSTVSLHIS